MVKHFEKYKTTYIIGASLIGICVGALSFIPIYQSIPVALGVWGIIHTLIGKVLSFYDDKDERYSTVVQEFENTLANQELVIQEHLNEIEEQKEVISFYEKRLDTMFVSLPCICGKGSFDGFYSPHTDNEVVCDKCNSKYRVTLQYDTVLISEPTDNDQPFQILVGVPEA